MIDIGNIDLTYEDGLRLSELLGQRAELAYSLDHILVHSLDAILTILIVVFLAWVAIMVYVYCFNMGTLYSEKVYEDDVRFETFKPEFKLLYKGNLIQDYETFSYILKDRSQYRQAEYELSKTRIAIVTLVPMLILAFAGVVLVVMYGEYDLSRQLAGVDAQIEELLSRYGVM